MFNNTLFQEETFDAEELMTSRKRAATPGRKNAKRIDEKEAVEVLCRLRPYDGNDGCAVVVDDEHVKLTAPVSLIARNGQVPQETTYKLSYVFDENDSQVEVFERSAMDLTENLVRGKNSLLFTYGVTGSGKTYTMNGGSTDETMGILPRVLDVLFNSLPNRVDKCVFAPDGRNGFEVREEFEAVVARKRLDPPREENVFETKHCRERRRVHGVNLDMVCAVFVSYIEVYNDVCYDLLDDVIVNRDGNRVLSSKDLRLGVNNKVYVENVVEIEVDSSGEALDLFLKGQEKRRVGDTLLNKQSSRSHSIFNIRLVSAPCRIDIDYPESNPAGIHVSQLSLVDLAGSERSKRTGNEGVRLVESGKINQSLLVLRQCFEKLRGNQRGCGNSNPVPYRDSKITHLFKNFFEGSGKVRMIICINPKPEDYAENLGVMGFAELSQCIEVASGSEFMLPVGDGLPISRREYLKWTNEVEKCIIKPTIISLFPNHPAFELSGPNDTESISRLREHYQSMVKIRGDLCEQFEQNEQKFETQLRRILCFVDLQTAQIQKLKTEKEDLDNELSSAIGLLRQYKREINALNKRIARYEVEENEKFNQEEEQKKREKAYQEQLRKKEKTLHLVREICDKPTPMRVCNEKTVSDGSVESFGAGEGSNPSALKPSLKHVGVVSSNRPIYSTTNEQSYQAPLPRRMGPNVAARTGFYNARHARRSKSANGRVIDHQPRYRIPEGTYVQTQIPRKVKSTTKVEAQDLKRSTEYVLTHQELDTRGNLTTQIVKGNCIPTAGGGTAVRFNDVERVSHESPSDDPSN
uniref:Kinesin-like protein n=1 Tax=Syphacia muris TaxID=451379 RepID=A0A0N5AQP8_9BILA